VAAQACIQPESLSRFENGRCTEFGSRKLLAVLRVLRMEIEFVEGGGSGAGEPPLESIDSMKRHLDKKYPGGPHGL
jgi:hypothetical protein